MNRFLAFVRKEFYHILRDRRTLLILFGMPVTLILLFGYAITNEIRQAGVAFLDRSRDEHTLRIRNKILASSYFTQTAELTNEKEIEEVFRDGTTKLVVIFGRGFGEQLVAEKRAEIQLIADASDPNISNTLVNYAQAMIGEYLNAMQGPESTLPMNVKLESRFWYNPELKGVYYFVPGLIAILLMLVSAMMTSISIAREKELGTMEVLLASPMQAGQVVLAKVVPYILLSFVDAIIILMLGKFVFHVPIHGSLALLLFETILFIMLALSLGILISTIVETQQAALLLSLMALMLPTILLSGFIFPIENMPWPLRIISNVIPARWFVVIVKSIMLKGSGLVVLWKETLILGGFIFFFLFLSVKKFKVRLQ